MKITKFEQSAITIELRKEIYAFDFGSLSTVPETLESNASATFVSHTHGDHLNIGNIKSLGSKVFGPQEVVSSLKQEGINAVKINDTDIYEDNYIKLLPFKVDHGPNLSSPIENFGFVIESKEKRVCFLGDMGAPTVIPNFLYDLIFVPVGGGKVFSPIQALDLLVNLNLSNNPFIVPMHFHGRSSISKCEEFQKMAAEKFEVNFLDVGHSLELA